MTAESWGLAASLALSGVFFLLAAYVALTRRPPVPQVPAATSDLGPETPAVANLLANGGRLTPDAVPATLLDLAARRLVAIEEAGPGAYGCRLGSRPPAALSAYESRVFELLRRQGSDGGLVPAQALTTGPAEQARGWLRGFEGEVVAEARGAGLCEPRWPPGLMMALAGAALGALALAVSSGSSDHPSNLQMVAIGTSALALFVLARAFSDKLQIVTRTGLPAQARWLALRRYLHDDEVFAGLPPTAVALRDRYLAYGAALGVAAAAVRAIPMGAENDRRAWTNYGGRWRQVAVTYPRGWPPGWGATPRGAAAAALKVGGIGAVALWLVSLLLPDLARGAQDPLTRGLELGVLVISVVAATMVLAGLYLLLGALLGLLVTKEVTGEAVRLRRLSDDRGHSTCFLALYPGEGDRVRAWILRPELYSELREYQVVTASVSPLIAYVRAVRLAADRQPVDASSSPSGAR